MKISRYISLIAAATLLSCEKEPMPVAACFRTANVKSLGHTGNARLYAFRDQDKLLEAYSMNDADSIVIKLIQGRSYHLYLTANRPDATSHYTETDFLMQRSLLEENNLSQPEMFASLHYSVGDDEPILELKRYLCKITIGSITVDWLNNLDEGTECLLETIAAVNVRGSVPISGTPDENGPWYNCACIEESPSADLKEKIIWRGSINLSTNPTEIGNSLFTMPNPSKCDDYGQPWTSRRTRIAIEVRINGTSNWYPIDLPPMKCNTDYHINEIVINGPGSPEVDMKIDRTSISFDVRVKPWESSDMTVSFND